MKMLNKYEHWYMEQMNNIIENGQRRGDRTGTGVVSLPDLEYRHDLRESHPVLWSRFFNLHMPIIEILWMMSGSSNILELKEKGCPFWNGFAVKGDKIVATQLSLTERLKLLAAKQGVPYGKVLQVFGSEKPEDIKLELDLKEIPDTQDMLVAKDGDLGPVYGHQWRYWPNPDGSTFDQLTYALEALRSDPNNRRIVVNCWNPSYLPDPKKSPAENAANGKMALTPCHFSFGFYTWEIPFHERAEMLKGLCAPEEWRSIYPITSGTEAIAKIEALCGKYDIPRYFLDLKYIMRSNDWILGQPANMNMYSAMLMVFAKELNMVPRYVKYTGWDCHVYTNHLEGAEELNRRWATGEHKYSNTHINLDTEALGLFNYRHDDFIVPEAYKPMDKIKFPIAI